MKPSSMQVVIGGLRYTTEKSILLAHDVYPRYSPIKHEYGPGGVNTFLYKTDNGNYFKQMEIIGSPSKIVPLSEDEARALYEMDLPMHEVEYTEAFPDVEVIEA